MSSPRDGAGRLHIKYAMMTASYCGSTQNIQVLNFEFAAPAVFFIQTGLRAIRVLKFNSIQFKGFYLKDYREVLNGGGEKKPYS